MKKTITMAILLGSTSAAHAGGYVAPTIQPQYTSSTVEYSPFNWSGGYIGAGVGRTSLSFKENRNIEHPAVTKEHPAKVEKVKVGEEKYWGPDGMDEFRRDDGLAPVRDPEHPTGWKHVEFFEEQVVEEAWTETVSEAWTETIVERAKENGTSYGAFVGYRHQFSNNVVVGGELSYFDGDSDAKMAEVQGGYAVGRALPYIAAGYAEVSKGSWKSDGAAVSLGLDYAVTDSWIVGAKYTHFDLGDKGDIAADANMVSLRVGYKF